MATAHRRDRLPRRGARRGYQSIVGGGLQGRWLFLGNQRFSTWNALRYRRVHEWLSRQHPPLVVTECGRDAVEGCEGKPGWKRQAVSAEQYAKELLAYATELEKDDYMLGAVVYTFGPWQDFADSDGEEIAGRMPAASQMIKIPSGGESMATFRVGNLEVIDLRARLLRHPTLRYKTRSIGGIEQIVIHHSATDDDRSAKAIAEYHVKNRGWPGIAYHFLVHQDGRIEYTQGIEVVSFGVARRNDNTLHICLVGNWTQRQPPEAQLVAARKLIDNLCFDLGRVYPVVGHKEIALRDYATACPGATWAQWKGRLTTA